MRQLQNIQNTICGMVTHTTRFSSITVPIKPLYWLPLKYIILFKLNVITYKALNSGSLGALKNTIAAIYMAARSWSSEQVFDRMLATIFLLGILVWKVLDSNPSSTCSKFCPRAPIQNRPQLPPVWNLEVAR